MANRTIKRGNSLKAGANKSPEENIPSIETLLGKLETGRISAISAADAIAGRQCVNQLLPKLKNKNITEPSNLLQILKIVESKPTANKNLQKAREKGIMEKAKEELDNIKKALIPDKDESETQISTPQKQSDSKSDNTMAPDWDTPVQVQDQQNKNKEEGGETKANTNTDMSQQAGLNAPQQSSPESAAVRIKGCGQETHSLDKTLTNKLDNTNVDEKKAESNVVNQKHLEEKLKETQLEVDHLKDRLGRVANEKLVQANPAIADLSDVNRPTKLAERFSELYDNQWTDAYEELMQKYKKEDVVIDHLFQVLREAMDFCKKHADKQLEDLVRNFRLPMLYPCTSEKERNNTGIKNSDGRLKSVETVIKNMRKEMAAASVTELQQTFFSQKKTQHLKKLGKIDKPSTCKYAVYTERTIEISWYMAVQVPPMHVEGCATKKSNPEHFRQYDSRGSKPDITVWPALYLHEGGSLMNKGVAVFK